MPRRPCGTRIAPRITSLTRELPSQADSCAVPSLALPPQAQGGLARLHQSYGLQSLVQLLSWLSLARYFPSDPWMEDECQQLLPATHHEAGRGQAQGQGQGQPAASGGLREQGSPQVFGAASELQLGLQEVASLGSSLVDMKQVMVAAVTRRRQHNVALGSGARVGEGVGKDGRGGARDAGRKQQAGAAAAAALR